MALLYRRYLAPIGFGLHGLVFPMTKVQRKKEKRKKLEKGKTKMKKNAYKKLAEWIKKQGVPCFTQENLKGLDVEFHRGARLYIMYGYLFEKMAISQEDASLVEKFFVETIDRSRTILIAEEINHGPFYLQLAEYSSAIMFLSHVDLGWVKPEVSQLLADLQNCAYKNIENEKRFMKSLGLFEPKDFSLEDVRLACELKNDWKV